MVDTWSEAGDQVHQEALEKNPSQEAELSRLPLLRRLIGGTGNVLSHARMKLSSWYSAEGDQSHAPHIDL